MIRHGMSHEDYLAVKAASKSTLWTIHTKSPLHAVTDKERTNAMEFGTAAHCAVLEPSAFAGRFVRGPDDRRGNKWKEAVEAAPVGADVLTAGDYDAAAALADRALGNADVQALVRGAAIEVSAFGALEGVSCKARPDAVNDGVLIDLKTTTDASVHAFRHTVHRFGYHVQEAWYRSVWAAAAMASPQIAGEMACVPDDLTASNLAVAFIVVESKPPFALRVFELDEAAVEDGRRIARGAFATYRECLAAGAWPGYPTGVHKLSLNARPVMGSEAEDQPPF